jgi:hypothetical protein
MLARYREPSCPRSIVKLVITLLPLVIFCILMWGGLGTGYWVCLLLAVPAADFLARLFMIQHDCGHGSFFRRHRVNDWAGRVIGVLTLTPNDFSRLSHASHHANSRNLDHRGIGDVDTLTVREFLALSRWRQLLYRLHRHPIVMFGVDTIIEALAPASFIICEDIVAPGGIIASIGVHAVKAGWHLERMLVRNIAITRRLVDTVSTPMLLGRHENTAERESNGLTRDRRD